MGGSTLALAHKGTHPFRANGYSHTTQPRLSNLRSSLVLRIPLAPVRSSLASGYLPTLMDISTLKQERDFSSTNVGSDYEDGVVELSDNLTVIDSFSLRDRASGLFNDNRLHTVPSSQMVSISANGSTPGASIVWVSQPSGAINRTAGSPGILRAFDSSVSKELWNSNLNTARDYVGLWASLCPPTIANGRVYLATFSNVLDVYGLLGSSTSASGLLSGAGDGSTGAVDLATEGRSDWIHWDNSGLRRKRGGNQLHDYSVISGGTATAYTDDQRPVSWTDGASTPVAANDRSGHAVSGMGNGFLLAAPADTNIRKLVVHAGGWSSGGTLTAHLSDRSAADFVDVTPQTDGAYDRNYVLMYSAASEGQILTVAWQMHSGSGAVSLSAASLDVLGASKTQLQGAMQSPKAVTATNVQASMGTPQSAIIDHPFSTALQATVTGAGNSPVSGVTVTFVAPGGVPPLNASYFSMALSDPDVSVTNSAGAFTNDEGGGGESFVTTVGAGLGPNGLPVLNATGQSILHDFNPSTGELEWWSTKDPNISVLNNSAYPPTIALPFSDNNMYTDTTVLGQNGDDSNAFLTATFTGTFALSAPGPITFSECSNDDSLVYISGGNFGAKGTLVVDNGGIHDALCTGANVNTNLLNDVPAGTYTITVFYDDRHMTGATFYLNLILPSTSTGSFNGGPTGTAITNSAGVATAPTFTANGQPGSYTVTGVIAGVSNVASFSLMNNLSQPEGALVGLGDSLGSGANLTAEGSVDWIHWGDATLNRKIGVTPQLSNYSIVGGGSVAVYANDPRPISWTDGTPTANITNDTNGVYISALAQGFSLTAPADPTTRNLTVHVGGWNSCGLSQRAYRMDRRQILRMSRHLQAINMIAITIWHTAPEQPDSS